MAADVTLDPPRAPGRPLPGTVVKTALGERRVLLRREAAVLRALVGLPVVRLVEIADGTDGCALRTVDAGPTTVADPRLSVRDRRRALADGCAAVAALHRAGWAHGMPTSDHLVVGTRLRVRWCSLGRAVPLAVDDRAAERDRVVLARAAHDLAREIGGRGLARRLRRLGDAPDPMELASVLRSRLDRPGRGLPMAAAAGVLAAALAVLSGDAPRAGGAGRRPDRPAPREVPLAAGPACGTGPQLALRPATGEVVRRTGGPGDDVAVVALVPGAVGWAPGSTCSAPVVARSDGVLVPLPPP